MKSMDLSLFSLFGCINSSIELLISLHKYYKSMKFGIITTWLLNNFRYYVVFSKPIFSMLGLVFSYSLVDKAVVGILITHLSEVWQQHQNLPKAATVVNLSEGTSAILQIFFAVVADAYLGRFTTVVCSAIAYIIGLFLCSLAARNEGLLYTALAILTLAQASVKVTLKAFLGDQLWARDKPSTVEEEERAYVRSSFWWNSVITLAAIVFLVLRVDSFRWLTFASAVLMTVAFVMFLSGTKFYERIKPTGSSLSYVLFVIRAAIIKRKEGYPQSPDQLFQNTNNLVQVLPHVPWLRWLDKAAVKPQENKSNILICSVEQVKGVKFLLKLLPIWTTFILFSVVSASGQTFFLLEAYENDDKYTQIQLFVLLQSLTKFISAAYLLEKLMFIKNQQRVMLVRIGIGMVCSVLCCVTACVNAAYWLRLVNLYDEPWSQTSVYRLVPQFFLLGLMEGASLDGFERFFYSQVPETLRNYGPPFGGFVMGIGNFVSVIFILIFFRRWFKDDINTSRLDKYYAALAAFSFANLLIYCYVARWYGDDQFFVEEVDEEMGGLNNVAEEFLGPRSLSGKYSRPRGTIIPRKMWFFPGPFLHKPVNTISEKDGSVALLNPNSTEQETASFSTDHETGMSLVNRRRTDINATGSSAAMLLRGSGSLSRVSFMGSNPQRDQLSASKYI